MNSSWTNQAPVYERIRTRTLAATALEASSCPRAELRRRVLAAVAKLESSAARVRTHHNRRRARVQSAAPWFVSRRTHTTCHRWPARGARAFRVAGASREARGTRTKKVAHDAP